MPLTKYLPADFLDTYEVHNYRHALEVLATGCPDELAELIAVLNKFRLTTADIVARGGNESQIPKRLSSLFRPLGWFETRVHGDLVVIVETYTNKGKVKEEETNLPVSSSPFEGLSVSDSFNNSLFAVIIFSRL